MNNIATLYIISTPIGNLDDISLRAIKMLQSVDLILCEDTRKSKILLDHLGIKKQLVSYHLYNEKEKLADIIQLILKHQQVALLSDAGTPLIADPGYLLLNECLKYDIAVVPIPGACALITALSVSGLPTNKFVFLGFLDKSAKKQASVLAQYTIEGSTIIFFESPNRLLKTLENLVNLYGVHQEIVIARELTKFYEEIKRDTLANMLAFYTKHNPKGEIVVLLYPKLNYATTKDDLITQIKYSIEESSPSVLAKQLAKKYKMNKDIIYDEILKIKNITSND